MFIRELRVLHVLLVGARCLGCFPFSPPPSKPAPAAPQRDETGAIPTAKTDRLSFGFRRSNAWTVWSLVMLILSVAGCALSNLLPRWSTHFSISNTIRTTHTLSTLCSLIAGSVLIVYLLLNSSSLIRLTNTLQEHYLAQPCFPESVWCPQKDWVFVYYLLIEITTVSFCVCNNIYYTFFLNLFKTDKACNGCVTSIVLLSWTLKDMVKGLVVSLLYATSQLLASLHSRVLMSLRREQDDITANSSKDQNSEEIYDMATATRATEEEQQRVTSRVQRLREASRCILVLHDTQRLMNDFFSYAVILVLTQALATSTSIIFYITLGGEPTPFRRLSYFFILECVSTIILTCCSSDPVQRQVCASCAV